MIPSHLSVWNGRHRRIHSRICHEKNQQTLSDSGRSIHRLSPLPKHPGDNNGKLWRAVERVSQPICLC
ncbi:hypothetical protein KAS06_01110 [Candidatus Bathyarchaeota archaeon]|nr:hypothetical protein [Candidatus Bathyarchaeota archaeon]